MMSYCMDGFDFLLVDDNGRVVGIVGSKWMADIAAKALRVDVERSQAGVYRVGDSLPSFHR